MKNTNILFFFSTTTIGGAETNIIKISRELVNRGYKIYWCSLQDNGPMLELVDFEVEYLNLNLCLKSIFYAPFNYWRFIKKNRITCVLNFGLKVELFSRPFSKLAGVKKVISNIRSTDSWRKFYHVWLDNFTSNLVDLWISNSEAGKNAFHSRENIPLEKIEVIYNFIELSPLTKHEFLIDKTNLENIRIGVLANITRDKGYFDLIPLSKMLIKDNINHLFVCAGKDMMNNLFHDQVNKNDLCDNFKFLGFVKDKNLFFDDIDVFLLPSYLEGLPTVLLEAMAMGLPIIATDVGGVKELIEHNYNGLIVTPGKIDELRASIKKIEDDSLRRAFISNGFKKLNNFSKNNIMDKWERAISN